MYNKLLKQLRKYRQEWKTLYRCLDMDVFIEEDWNRLKELSLKIEFINKRLRFYNNCHCGAINWYECVCCYH